MKRLFFFHLEKGCQDKFLPSWPISPSLASEGLLEKSTFLWSSYSHLAQMWGLPSTLADLCLRGCLLSSALEVLQVALCFTFQQGLHRMPQFDLAPGAECIKLWVSLRVFYSNEETRAWSPRGFPGLPLVEKLGVWPCMSATLCLLHTHLESFARRRLLYCLSLWNLFYVSASVFTINYNSFKNILERRWPCARRMKMAGLFVWILKATIHPSGNLGW